jgi:carboxylesterase
LANTGCLLIHGFTGCRNDLEPLRRCLEQRGYNVSVPVLRGHEATANELRAANRRDWIACAQTELDKLQRICETVIVIGFSMGGLIAANLCQSNRFDGIVFINTPVYYWGLGRMVFNLYSDFRTNLKKYMLPARNTPFHAMLEFQLLLSRTKPMFEKIGCRSLVLQSINDDVADPQSAEFIFSRLKGPKEIKKVSDGGHVVLLSEGSGQVCSDVQNFLKAL